jgi:hypothetical protein
LIQTIYVKLKLWQYFALMNILSFLKQAKELNI